MRDFHFFGIQLDDQDSDLEFSTYPQKRASEYGSGACAVKRSKSDGMYMAQGPSTAGQMYMTSQGCVMSGQSSHMSMGRGQIVGMGQQHPGQMMARPSHGQPANAGAVEAEGAASRRRGGSRNML